MKVFVGILVAFATIISVNCDAREDQQNLIAKEVPIYLNLTEDEVKSRVAANAKLIDANFKNVTDLYDKIDLKPMAQFYRDFNKFVQNNAINAWPIIDKLEPETRKNIVTGLGVSTEVGVWTASEYKKKSVKPIKVTDTEDVLNKKYQGAKAKVLDMLKTYVKQLKKQKETLFWSTFMQNVEDFITKELSNFESDVKKLTTTDVKAKNIEVMVEDINDVYERERP